MAVKNSLVCGLPLAALAVACGAVSAAEIEPAVRAQAQSSARSDVILVMRDQARPSLAPLANDANYRDRRRALVAVLRARADNDQRGLRAWLDARGIVNRPYWIANVIAAKVTANDLAALAARDDVARVTADPAIALRLPPPQKSAGGHAPDAIEWGVMKIRAPDVWAAGFNGQGVVIAGEDTGYQWDHPALKPHYRGWDGANADHAYNWHDAIHDAAPGNTCGSDSPFPCDDVDHGTHTAGTFVGDDGATHQIGVAPGAQWIGCRNMDAGNGTPSRYIECMQWMLAPTDLADQNPDPDLAPDVVSNSWTCPPTEGCTVGDELAEAVDNVVAGGIFFAAAAANDGPSCETITGQPAIFDASFVVGATDRNDALADFSSRGPVLASELFRPDISAPGVSVRSSVPVNQYAVFNGTSMATPHVAGAAALLMSVNPALKGHPDQIAQLLRDSAVTDGVTDPSNSGCGGLTMADSPNYQVGYGRLDAFAAATLAGLGAPDDTVFDDGFDGG